MSLSPRFQLAALPSESEISEQALAENITIPQLGLMIARALRELGRGVGPRALATASVSGPAEMFQVQFRKTNSHPWRVFGGSVSHGGAVIDGLDAATSYDFQVLAGNAAGFGLASAAVTLRTTEGLAKHPGEVVGLTATGATAQSLMLAWAAPTSGGTVERYQVKYAPVGSSKWSTATVPDGATVLRLTELLPATTYVLHVLAQNDTGPAARPGSAIASTLAAATDEPQAVDDLQVTATTDCSVSLAWSPPAGNAPAETFSVTVQAADGSSLLDVPAITDPHYTATGLKAGTAYLCVVTGANAAGAGPASSPVMAQTNAAGTRPGSVSQLAAGATATSITLSWAMPTNGGPVDSTSLRYRLTNASTPWTIACEDIAGTSAVVHSLLPATSYDFHVIATNAAGPGAASALLTAATSAAAEMLPGPVTGLTASRPAASSITLSWTPPVVPIDTAPADPLAEMAGKLAHLAQQSGTTKTSVQAMTGALSTTQSSVTSLASQVGRCESELKVLDHQARQFGRDLADVLHRIGELEKRLKHFGEGTGGRKPA